MKCSWDGWRRGSPRRSRLRRRIRRSRHLERSLEPEFAHDERSLQIRFGEALARIRGRLATVEELPALFEEYEIRTVVVTDERLPLPEGVERLPLDRAARPTRA